jgi:hypothetical protein
LQARNDGFQQPFHTQSVIVNPPQINIRGHFAISQRPVEMFRAGFSDVQASDAVKILVFDGGLPAFKRFIRFFGDDIFHHVLPRPCRQFGICGVQVNSGQSKVYGRLAFGFIHGVDLLHRLRLFACLETY